MQLAPDCPRCLGRGRIEEEGSSHVCPACNGTGKMNRRARVIARFSETPDDSRLALDSLARSHGLTRRVSTEPRDGFEWNPKLVLFIETDAALKTRIETAGKP